MSGRQGRASSTEALLRSVLGVSDIEHFNQAATADLESVGAAQTEGIGK